MRTLSPGRRDAAGDGSKLSSESESESSSSSHSSTTWCLFCRFAFRPRSSSLRFRFEPAEAFFAFDTFFAVIVRVVVAFGFHVAFLSAFRAPAAAAFLIFRTSRPVRSLSACCACRRARSSHRGVGAINLAGRTRRMRCGL
jgi:hypothetical protein